jgi:hypothetical protein
MIITKEDVIPSLIPNTVMQKFLVDGVHKQYTIAPAEGYVVHDNRLDYPVADDYGEPTGEVILGYSEGMKSVSASYDFVANPYEIYAVPRNTVPEDQIFGGGNNNHEVM